jgi:hypothetical protein
LRFRQLSQAREMYAARRLTGSEEESSEAAGLLTLPTPPLLRSPEFDTICKDLVSKRRCESYDLKNSHEEKKEYHELWTRVGGA